MPRPHAVSRAAVVLIVATGASQLLGLIRDAVIAAVFGAGAALDAYLVSLGLINLVIALVAAPLARAVVPTLSRAADTDSARGNRTVQVALTSALLVLITGSLVMYAAAPVLVAALAPGFDASTTAMAVQFTRILLGATVVVAATDILAAAAQAHGRYLFSGLEGIGFNLVMITAALWFGYRYGVYALCIGFVLGSVTRLALQLIPLRAMRWRLRPRLRWSNTDFSQIVELLPALMVTSVVVNVNTLVDRAVGSAQGTGTIVALSFGWRIVTLVNTLLVLTVAAALFPAFSAATEPRRRAELRRMIGRALRVMLTMLVPVTAFLVLSAVPMIALLFGRGAFTASDVALTAVAVSGYAVGATALGLRTIASRASLALGDSRATMFTALIIMVTNVIGDLTLGVAYGVSGLAASTSGSLALGALALLWQLSRRHRAVDLPALLLSTLRTLLSGAGALVITFFLGLPHTLATAEASIPLSLAALALTGLVLLGCYLVLLWLLRGPEVRDLVEVARQQLAKLPPSRRRKS